MKYSQISNEKDGFIYTFVLPDELVLDAVPERVFDILKPEVFFAIRLYAQVINDLVDKRVQIGLL